MPPPAARRASLWSSCVVLPLLALTWMSAVLAVTDRRSALFQILFAVFDSLEGFVIVMVHCILRREVGGSPHARAAVRGAWPARSQAAGNGRLLIEQPPTGVDPAPHGDGVGSSALGLQEPDHQRHEQPSGPLGLLGSPGPSRRQQAEVLTELCPDSHWLVAS